VPVHYFDHNATHPLSSAAREAWLDATARFIGNPSSPHRLGDRADRVLAQARERLADWLGCAAHEIVWTSGATESNNTAIASFAEDNGGEAWVSAIEHPCVLAAVRRYFPEQNRCIPVTREGVIELDWMRAEFLKRRPSFVGVMAANNETGVLQPWREVRSLCREWEVPLLCDAAQWIGKLPARGLGDCEAVSGCAHKFGGPAGVGFLKTPARMRPLIVGGPQEEGRRAGTENVPGVLAMIAALEERERAQEVAGERMAMRTQFERELCAAVPGIEIVGAGAERLWNTVSAIMPEIDCRQRWVVKLDKLGCAVSTGSACASGKEEPSHVLAAMGYSSEQAARVLRFSSGWETREADWSILLGGVLRAIAAER